MFKIFRDIARSIMSWDDKVYLKWLDLKDRYATYKIVRAWEKNMKEVFGMNKEHWFLVFAPTNTQIISDVTDEIMRGLWDEDDF